jgi:hypothetical protein
MHSDAHHLTDFDPFFPRVSIFPKFASNAFEKWQVPVFLFSKVLYVSVGNLLKSRKKGSKSAYGYRKREISVTVFERFWYIQKLLI